MFTLPGRILKRFSIFTKSVASTLSTTSKGDYAIALVGRRT
jgi:hypothetical protein